MKKFLQHPARSKSMLFWVAVILILFPFLVISLYNHPSADDFCYATDARTHGFVAAQAEYYFDWTGRYMATALLIMNPVDLQDLTGYRILPILLLILFSASLFLFLGKLLPENSSREKSRLTLFILFLYLYETPNIAEAFYWMAGSVNYQLASVLTLLLFSLILHLQQNEKRQMTPFFIFIGSLLAISIVGLNETSMIILCGILSLWSVIRFYRKKTLEASMKILLVITFMASAVVVAAPGNAVRMAEKPEKFQLLFSLFGSLRISLLNILEWLPMSVLLLAFSLPLLKGIAGKVNKRFSLQKFALKHLLLLGIILLVFLTLCFFPAFWSQGGRPPDRTINVIYLLFIFFELIFTVLFLVFLENQNKKTVLNSIHISTVAGFTILGFLVFKQNNINTAYKDLILGTASRYDQEMRERYRILWKCPVNSCTVPPLENKPSTIFAYDLAPDPSDEIYYYNECFSEYFEKKNINAVTKDSEPDLEKL